MARAMGDVREALGASDLRRSVVRFRDALRMHQEELNRLNVYPVPDGDTGTNMALTLEAVVTELGTAEQMPEVCRAIARGSLMGARGNSGVITSQILRGLADEFGATDAVGAGHVVAGLQRASDAAYQAVLRPVEGTILTVVRAAAGGAAAVVTADAGADLLAVLDGAAAAANEAVERTPDLLPVLADAGVVDAGGKGFALLLDALLEVVDGRPLPEPTEVSTPAAVRDHPHDDVSDLRYEVMFLLDADDGTIPAFKESWGAIGDSIVVVGGDGIWNCHVHTNDIGAAIEAGIEAGRPHQIRVTDLADEVAERAERDWVADHLGAGDDALPEVTCAVVAVGVGDGVARLFRSLGVQAIVAGGQSMNPSTAQILEAVERCASDSVVVLPNNKNIIPVAGQVDALTDRRVAVVPTRSVIEALSGLVDYDPDADLATNVAAMGDAVTRVRAGEVTRAVRDSVAECGPIAAGDWLAIGPDGIHHATDSALGALTALVDDLVDEASEIATVITGRDADPTDTQRVREHLALEHPHVEVEFHDGGQPLYPYLVGVE